MNKLHGKAARVYLNAKDLSTFFNSLTFTHQQETAEITGYGDQAKHYIQGLRNATLQLQGYYDHSNVGADQLLRGIAGLSDAVVTLPIEDKYGGFAIVGTNIITSLTLSAPIGGIVAANLDMQTINGLLHSIVLVPKSDSPITGQTSPVGPLNGGVAQSGVRISCVLHSFATSGSPSVSVQHSPDGSSWLTLVPFGSIVASQFYQATIQSGTIEPWLRAEITGGSAIIHIAISIE